MQYLESDRRLKLVLKATHTGLWEWNLLSDRITWSANIEQLLGMAPGSFEGTYAAWLDQIYLSDRLEVQAAIAHAIKTCTDYSVEFRVVWSDGSIHWLASTGEVTAHQGQAVQLTGLCTDITERKQAEAVIQIREQRLRRQSEVLVELARRNTLDYWDLQIALQEITEVAAQILEVARASIWLYNDDCSKICCLDLYEQAANQHTAGVELGAVDFPQYFAALKTKRTIAAHDARTDPRTGEFTASYLVPLGITSMLDAPIWLNGRMVGVVCHEHVGVARTWALEEEHFAGSIADLVAHAMEAHERRRAEAELRESQQRLSLLFQQAPLAIIEWNLEFEVTEWNPAAEVIFGYSKPEALGRHAAGLIIPEAAKDHVDEVWRSLLNQKGGTRSINTNLTKDGSLIMCEWYNTPLINWEGNTIGVASLALNVTQRHQAEIDLKQAKDQLEQRVEERTQELRQVVQHLQDEIIERTQVEKALRESEARSRQQAEQLTETLRELQKTQAQLIQSEKMSSLGQLVAGIAHEINNPVNFIYGNISHAKRYAQDLLDLTRLYQKHYPLPEPEIQKAIATVDLEFILEDLPKILLSMKVGADRIRQIVLSLRNFSRLDEADMKPVDIHEGIDSTLLILQNRLKAKPGHSGIEVLKEYGPLPQVDCYAGQLNQVFMNILANALDALEGLIEHQIANANGHTNLDPNFAPCIRIHTQTLGHEQVQIHISDNGPGMPETVRQQLFDPFFTTKPVGKGTGLGLSISYHIVVEKHQGQLECRSTLGQGTEFLITIPIQQIQQQQRPKSAEPVKTTQRESP